MSCVLCGEFCIMGCELPVMSFELYRRTHINYINTCSHMHSSLFRGTDSFFFDRICILSPLLLALRVFL